MGANFSAIIEHNLSDEQSIENFLKDLVHRSDLFPTIHKISSNLPGDWRWIRELDLSHSYGTTSENWCKDLIRKVEKAKSQGNYMYPNVWDEFVGQGILNLEGPDSVLSMMFNPHIFELSSYIRWHSFLRDKETQSKLRNVCKELCCYFNKNHCIYMSDSFCASDYVYDGKSMDQYKKHLLKRFGEPKHTIDDLYIALEDSWRTTEGYYIDYF